MAEEPEETAPVGRRKKEGTRRAGAVAAFVGVWVLMSGLAVGLQVRGGVYAADFGSHPDEASHLITGLMVRDYLVGGLPGNPLRYAENYYAHYPKVALGHYPPGFYVAEGLWLSVFPAGKWSVLGFLAAQSGLLGALVFAVSARRVGVWLGLVAGAVAVALPITQNLAAAVMSDLLLSVFCFLAVWAFARYLGGGKWQDSLWFGIWAMAATMVKGSGLLLALVVPMAMVLSGRWEVVKRPGLWLGALPVVLVAGPWMYFTRHITAEGMTKIPFGEHVASVFPYFASQWVLWIGWVVSVLAVTAVVAAVRRGELRGDALLVCLVALPLALVLFYAVIPAGLDTRYLMPVIGPVLVLAAVGGRELGRMFKMVPAWVPATVLLGLAAVEMVRVPQKEVGGWEEIAGHIVDGSGGERVEVLVVSDARGEGALMAEIALRDPERPGHRVFRGSKALATSDWLGRDYEGAFTSRAEVAAFLAAKAYPWVVVDRSVPEVLRRPYHDQIEEVMEVGEGVPLRRDGTFPVERQKGVTGEAEVYRAVEEAERK